MRGDFSRLVLDGGGYSRVLMQQGRVLMDSDWNAAVAELLSAQRTLAADLIGPHGGPAPRLGFAATLSADGKSSDLQLGPGVYYVDGLRCELAGTAPISWTEQPYPPFLTPPDLPKTPFLLYLEAGERLVTVLQDDSLREVALGGPDTTARAQLIWQVRTAAIDSKAATRLDVACKDFPLDDWRAAVAGSPPLLRVWAGDGDDDDGPCPIGPDDGYLGAENQLYRVEIISVDGGTVTFAWSRENGSVVVPWLGTDSPDLLIGPVRDRVRGFSPGDWVELGWDGLDLAGVAGTFVRVKGVAEGTLTVEPATASGPVESDPATRPHAYVRRWDQRDRRDRALRGGAIGVTEVTGDTDRQPLENGIEVQFLAPASGGAVHTYRVGDYWTFAARVATGGVDWPVDDQLRPLPLPPQGPVRHYAPLGWFGAKNVFTDLRRRFDWAACAE